MNKIISGNGGDIFKFAGDAMIVLWPPSDDLGDLARRATQCAIEIQRALDQSHAEVAAFSAGPAPADGRGAPPGKAAQVNLSVKIGVGVGDVAVLRRRRPRRGVRRRRRPAGPGGGAEHHGAAGHVVCSKEAWALVGDHFGKLEDAGGGFVRVDAEARYAKTRCQGIAAFTEDRLSSASTDPKTEAALEVRLERYIPRSVLAALQRDSRECEKWANEITSCVVVFVNLGISEAMLNGAADARSDPDGSRLRFLHDAFGAAKAGTLVAGGDEDAPCGGVLVDAKLRDRVGPVLRFASLGEITVKGKSEKISIFHPYGPRRTLDWPDDPRTAAAIPRAATRRRDVAAGRRAVARGVGADDDSDDGDAVDLLDDEGYDMGQLVAREPAFARRSRLLWRRLEGEEFLDDDRDHAVVRYAGEAAPSRLVVECAEGGALLGFGGDAAADCLAFDLDGCERPTMRDLRDRAPRRPSRRACCRPRGAGPVARGDAAPQGRAPRRGLPDAAAQRERGPGAA
ncbi:adenylate cyclase [Aureococcus anophagefferens]|nr:adenylate cyclase [Aureococcus anophagefferens]